MPALAKIGLGYIGQCHQVTEDVVHNRLGVGQGMSLSKVLSLTLQVDLLALAYLEPWAGASGQMNCWTTTL
jgi:hypothetical protein